MIWNPQVNAPNTSSHNIYHHQHGMHLHQLTTLTNFQHSNDDKTIHVNNLEVSIYKIRALVIMETSLYTSFLYKFTDKRVLMENSSLYSWHLFLNIPEISSSLHSSKMWWIVSFTWHLTYYTNYLNAFSKWTVCDW